MLLKRFLMAFAVVMAVAAFGVLTAAAQDDDAAETTATTVVEENTDLFRFVIGGCSSFDSVGGNDISNLAPLDPGDQHRVLSYSGTSTAVGESAVVQINWVRIATSEVTSVWVQGSCGTLIFAGS